MDYISNLRKYIGTQPIIMCGANVILINAHDEILLHHRTDRDWWGLPGGAMELGESLEDTARREVFEEINLECLELELFNVYSGRDLYYKYPDGNEVYNVTATYLCKVYRGDIKVEKTEGRAAKFFKISELPSNISSPVLPIIRAYIQKQEAL